MQGILVDQTHGFAASTVTVGDWFTMTQSPFGHDSAWNDLFFGRRIADDNAMLIEYASVTIAAGQTVQAGGILIGSLGTVQSSVNDGHSPEVFAIRSISPNPITDHSLLRYDIPKNGPVRISVFDQLGREVKTILNTIQGSGQYSADLDVSGLANGSYFVRVESDGQQTSQAIAILR
jgi:hypothetical protein